MNPEGYIGRKIDFDKAYGYQCVDLVNQFVVDRGLPRFTGGAAADMFGQSPGSYEWVRNTPSGVPPEGAIVVWDRGVGPWGHIAIARKGSTTSVLKTVDQNWNGRPDATAVDHNYSHVIGWGIPRIQNNNTNQGANMGVPNAQYDAVVVDNYNLNLKLREYEAINGGLNNQIKDLQKEIANLKAEIVKLQANQGKSEDTELLNSFGKLLVQLLTRLGVKK